MEKLITQRALSDLLGRSIKSLERDRQTGRFALPYVRLGRKIMFRRADIEKFLDQSTDTQGCVTEDNRKQGAGVKDRSHGC